MSQASAMKRRTNAIQFFAEMIRAKGLTPMMMYGFQVQALGVLGYSDWSTVETIVVN
jgi:hypothetical protein